MFPANRKQILFPDHRLPAGINKHKRAQRLALGDDGIDLGHAEIQLMTIFRRPAAGAMQVAGRGRIKQDRPRHVAVVFRRSFNLTGAAFQTGVDDKVGEKRLAHAGVQVIQLQHQIIPMILLFDHC